MSGNQDEGGPRQRRRKKGNFGDGHHVEPIIREGERVAMPSKGQKTSSSSSSIYSPPIRPSSSVNPPAFDPNYTESYLLWRFRREGWIANKTLQKLAGTNPVIGISSDLSL